MYMGHVNELLISDVIYTQWVHENGASECELLISDVIYTH